MATGPLLVGWTGIGLSIPAQFTKAVGDIARLPGMMQLARDTGITRDGLFKALGEQGNPSFATVVQVMHALGLQFSLGVRSA